MSNSDNKFIPGLFFKDKHENAPDFVICKGSIKVADMRAFLATVEDEWVNFDLKRSRDGKPYAQVDDWKPNTEAQGGGKSAPRAKPRQPAGDEFPDEAIPFATNRGDW